jgi:hypothetical protein
MAILVRAARKKACSSASSLKAVRKSGAQVKSARARQFASMDICYVWMSKVMCSLQDQNTINSRRSQSAEMLSEA